MRSNIPVRASIFILHYGSTESGIQWINKFLWSMEESRKALTSAIFTSTSCVCTPTPSLPIQSISRLFHLFYALHDAVLYLQPDTLFSLSRLSWWHVTLCHAKRTSGIVFCHLLATPRQSDEMGAHLRNRLCLFVPPIPSRKSPQITETAPHPRPKERN